MIENLRKKSIKKCFDARSELEIKNKNYRDFIIGFFNYFLDLDLEAGDASQFPPQIYQTETSAIIKAKESGIIAGLDEIGIILESKKILFESYFRNGDTVNSGDVMLRISGKASTLLALERTILNVLQRLCGIATITAKYSDKIKSESCFVVGTRKTLWSKLDKRAVQCGGGLTHRLNLADAAMLKENHLSALKKSNHKSPILEGIREIIANQPNLRFIEVEVTSEEEFWQIVKIYNALETRTFKVIMFDHFTPENISKLIADLKQKGYYDNILFEASGNITLETISDYADCGVDVISSGALTHSVTGLDLTMLIDNI